MPQSGVGWNELLALAFIGIWLCAKRIEHIEDLLILERNTLVRLRCKWSRFKLPGKPQMKVNEQRYRGNPLAARNSLGELKLNLVVLERKIDRLPCPFTPILNLRLNHDRAN